MIKRCDGIIRFLLLLLILVSGFALSGCGKSVVEVPSGAVVRYGNVPRSRLASSVVKAPGHK